MFHVFPNAFRAEAAAETREFPRIRGPSIDSIDARALIVRTPTKGTSNLWTQP